MKRGPKFRDHKAIKIYGKPEDLASIRAYLSNVQQAQRLTDRSAAGVLVFLHAKDSGFFLDPAAMQEVQ